MWRIFNKIISVVKFRIRTLSEFLMGIFILYLFTTSIYEIIIRLSKPEEFYSCFIGSTDDSVNLQGSPFNSSIRISWPFQFSELWVKQTGNALIDGDRFDIVLEGAGTRDHVVAGRQLDGEKVFNFDRVSGNLSIHDDRAWTKGICTRKVRDF